MDNEEYSQQLSVYMKEIEILVEEMDKMKGTRRYCEEIIEEEAEDDPEVDEEEVKRDLILHGEDMLSATQEGNYMLQDIIELDSKINAYIHNFSRKYSNSDQES